MARHLSLFILSITICNGVFSQAPDTISLHRPFIFGIPYYKCKRIWFCNYEGVFSYSQTTRQDRFIANDTSYYFKVYGYSKRLLFEGRKEKYGALEGEVKFYYRNGKVKHTWYFRNSDETGQDSLFNSFCDGPSPWGTWKYYDRKGRVRKTIYYSDERIDDYSYIKCITTFRRDGRIKSTRKKEHHPCEM